MTLGFGSGSLFLLDRTLKMLTTYQKIVFINFKKLQIMFTLETKKFTNEGTIVTKSYKFGNKQSSLYRTQRFYLWEQRRQGLRRETFQPKS